MKIVWRSFECIECQRTLLLRNGFEIIGEKNTGSKKPNRLKTLISNARLKTFGKVNISVKNVLSQFWEIFEISISSHAKNTKKDSIGWPFTFNL